MNGPRCLLLGSQSPSRGNSKRVRFFTRVVGKTAPEEIPALFRGTSTSYSRTISDGVNGLGAVRGHTVAAVSFDLQNAGIGSRRK